MVWRLLPWACQDEHRPPLEDTWLDTEPGSHKAASYGAESIQQRVNKTRLSVIQKTKIAKGSSLLEHPTCKGED